MAQYYHRATIMMDFGSSVREYALEVDFDVHPDYKGGRINPPEGPELEIRKTRFICIDDGKELPCPDWLAAMAMPSDDELFEVGRGQMISERENDRW